MTHVLMTRCALPGLQRTRMHREVHANVVVMRVLCWMCADGCLLEPRGRAKGHPRQHDAAVEVG